MIPSVISSYQVKLNSKPEEPKSKSISAWLEGGESVISIFAKKWVEAHHEYYQPALKSLQQSIKRITHSVFKKHLKKVVVKFNEELDKVDDKSYTVLVQSGKSNQWVAELALKYLSEKPTDCLPLGEKQARDYSQYLDTLSKTDRVAKRIVLFDDASYSGKQLRDHVAAIFEKHAKLKSEPTVHVVVPFATKYAVAQLKKLPQYEKGLLKLSLSGKISSISETLSPKHIETLTELYGWSTDEVESQGRGIIYFDHKIPNGMSFVEPFAIGSVYPGSKEHQMKEICSERFKTLPTVKPPYKG